MKKIIAIAVASAFVAPAFAADVALTGDVEYVLENQSGVSYGTVGDADFKITATEEMSNGMSVTAYIDNEDTDLYGSAIEISGGFGTVAIGDDVGPAFGSFDEITDKAEKGGDIDDADNAAAEAVTAKWSVATGVEGLSLDISYGAGTEANDETVTSYAIQYTTGGFTAFVGTGTEDSDDDDQDVSTFGLSYAMGPLYIAYESVDNLNGVEDDEMTAFAVSYNYGVGAVTIEKGEVVDADNTTTDQEITAVSASYKLGSVNTYIATREDKLAGADVDDITYVGVEYAF